ncbi:hypothetical protein GCM10007301_09340 [Azorhizobium oxalatiphilum]|uniref:Uncharacterized protein n=1 Tax=Azorhizobium oxalatiphilum TaxID=980631 RepID=A0A917BPM8_9HYPH|nr:hypothetical protein [Azorhizobium oxalatiphilum]GGF52007.1 hypothetical protein GCM10007301_09340 [Azorhizobium oxalatiphilum]
MTTLEKTVTVADTALSRLEQENRLFNAVLKGPTKKPGRFGFRGDIALKFQAQLADEKRPPDFSIEQVLTIAEAGAPTLEIFVGYIHSFAYLPVVAEVMKGILSPTGTNFIFCNNIDFLAKYRVVVDGITYFVLPCDESTVWKEMTDLLSVDKNDIKKLDTAGKLDHVLDKAIGFKEPYTEITVEEGIAKMEPVKNRNENRPV